MILSSNAVDPLLALGRWDRAASLIERTLALAPPSAFRVYLQRAKLWLVLWRGDPDAAASQSRAWSSWSTAQDGTEAQHLLGTARVLAEIALAQGHLEEAWAHAAVLFADDHRALPPYDLPLLAVAAAILARRRALAPAAQWDDAEAALRALLGAERFWPSWDVWSAQVEAELGGGGTGSDVEAWRHAIRAAEHGPAHLRPYGQYRLGQALVASDERTEAREVLRTATALAEELGAGLIVAQVAAFARSAGLVLTEDTTLRPADGVELTAREQQVLELLAQGLSNRQIGTKLFISAKTASVHVSAILRKLGAASRTEAAFLASSAAR